MLAGGPLAADCPLPWRQWVTGRHYLAMISARIEYRTPHDQQRQDQAGWKSSTGSTPHFADRPTGFEQFAAHLWQMADGHVGTYEVTRATADGGRDTIGEYLIALRYRVMAPA